jgi:hypothetical protein
VAAVVGIALLVVCLIKAPLELRLWIAFSAVVFAASLVSSTVPPPTWKYLAGAPGLRYFFFPTLACAWAILWAIFGRIKWLQGLTVILLSAMVLAIVHDWRQPKMEDQGFAGYVRSFQNLPPGTAFDLPVDPQGYRMRLIKHGAR